MLDALNPDLRKIVLPCRPWALATERAAELVLLIGDEEPGDGVGLVWALWRWPGGELQDVAIGRA